MLAPVDRHRAADQFTDQPRLPRAPRCRAGGERVGFGEGVQQAEHPGAAGSPRHRLDGRDVVDVPAGRGFGEQQMMAHHRDQHLGVRGREPEAGSDHTDDGDAGFGVIAGPAFADVVQQSAEQEQIGPVDAAGRRGRGRRCFDQVPIDGEAVVRVALRFAAYPFPFGQQPDEQADLVKSFHDRDRGRAGGQQGNQRVARRVRPWGRHGRGLASKPVERVPPDRNAGPGGRGGNPQRQCRVTGRVRVPGELRLAVLLDHPFIEGTAGRAAAEPARGRP